MTRRVRHFFTKLCFMKIESAHLHCTFGLKKNTNFGRDRVYYVKKKSYLSPNSIYHTHATPLIQVRVEIEFPQGGSVKQKLH